MEESQTFSISPEKGRKEWKYWFDGLVQNIRTHQMMLEEGVARKEVEELYDTMFKADELTRAQVLREKSSKYFIEQIVRYFLLQLRSSNANIKKLALHLTDAKIMAWAEIEDDDVETEDILCDAEAKINAKFSDYGFHLDSIILEESDNVDIPPQYSVVITNS